MINKIMENSIKIRSLGILILFFISINCDLSEKEVNQKLKENPVELKVGYLHDNRLPEISNRIIKKSLEYARQYIADEFGIPGLRFNITNRVPIDRYFKKVIGNKKDNYNALDPFKVEVDFSITDTQNKKFYKYYKFKDLLRFIPDKDKYKINSLDDYHRYTLNIWLNKTKNFITAKYNGKYIFTRESMFFQKYTEWLKLFKYQEDYDIIFQNTLVLYDDLDIPFPHTIYKHAKVGGMGDYSPLAPGKYKGLIVVSTIEYAGIKNFSIKNKPSQEMLAKYLGFYIAHEFGHAALRLGDVYDHPLHCLMNTPPQNIDNEAALKYFEGHRGPCPMCKDNLLKGKRMLLKLYMDN